LVLKVPPQIEGELNQPETSIIIPFGKLKLFCPYKLNVSCFMERNASFVSMKSWLDMEPRRDAIDFVRCNRTNSAGVLTGRVWSVAILLDGEKTTGEVLVSHYIDGP
jgi:hypothetical protein